MNHNYKIITISQRGEAKHWFCQTKEAAMNFIAAFIKSGDYIQVLFQELPYILH